MLQFYCFLISKTLFPTLKKLWKVYRPVFRSLGFQRFCEIISVSEARLGQRTEIRQELATRLISRFVARSSNESSQILEFIHLADLNRIGIVGYIFHGIDTIHQQKIQFYY